MSVPASVFTNVTATNPKYKQIVTKTKKKYTVKVNEWMWVVVLVVND